MSLNTGQKAVTSTAAALTSTDFPVETLILKALPNNTGTVYFGVAGVTTGTGYPLEAGEEFQFSPALDNLKRTPKPKDVYVVASGSVGSVAWAATPR